MCLPPYNLPREGIRVRPSGPARISDDGGGPKVTTFSLSRHAIDRALEMCLEPDFIRALMLRPDAKWWNESTAHGACWMFRKDDINAPADELDDGTFRIRTFLPATEERWRQDEHAGRRFDPSRFN